MQVYRRAFITMCYATDDLLFREKRIGSESFSVCINFMSE